MKRFWILLPILFLITACGNEPGDPNHRYYLIQKVSVGHIYQAEKTGATIRYSGMLAKDTIAFATPHGPGAVNGYYPKNAKVIDNGISRFKVHEVNETYVILEWIGWSAR